MMTVLNTASQPVNEPTPSMIDSAIENYAELLNQLDSVVSQLQSRLAPVSRSDSAPLNSMEDIEESVPMVARLNQHTNYLRCSIDRLHMTLKLLEV